jgi:hypothetical protein
MVLGSLISIHSLRADHERLPLSNFVINHRGCADEQYRGI